MRHTARRATASCRKDRLHALAVEFELPETKVLDLIAERRCAMTREKALPVLQAAHIQSVTRSGKHRVDKGILLRSDVLTLFDQGYVTVIPDYRVAVSSRLKKDFDNGEPYYRLHGSNIWLPPSDEDRPNRQHLEWYADTASRG